MSQADRLVENNIPKSFSKYLPKLNNLEIPKKFSDICDELR